MQTRSNEITLVEKLNEGSVTAFDELYFRYHKMVFANIYKLVKNQEEAEELMQDVFVALWQNREKIDKYKGPSAWLAVVSHNKAINHLSKSIRLIMVENSIDTAEIPDFTETPDTSLDIQLGMLNEAIDKLPPMKKQAFTLCKLQGKTYAEAASILDISPNTVKEHIVLATKFIKSYTTAHHSGTVFSSAIVIIGLICK